MFLHSLSPTNTTHRHENQILQKGSVALYTVKRSLISRPFWWCEGLGKTMSGSLGGMLILQTSFFYIHFLSSVELEQRLTDVLLFLSSTLIAAFQPSKDTSGQGFPPDSCGGKTRSYLVQTISLFKTQTLHTQTHLSCFSCQLSWQLPSPSLSFSPGTLTFYPTSPPFLAAFGWPPGEKVPLPSFQTPQRFSLEPLLPSSGLCSGVWKYVCGEKISIKGTQSRECMITFLFLVTNLT